MKDNDNNTQDKIQEKNVLKIPSLIWEENKRKSKDNNIKIEYQWDGFILKIFYYFLNNILINYFVFN